MYGAINAGGMTDKHMGRSDRKAGGTPGNVWDKWNHQMGPHRARARKLLQSGGEVLPDPFANKPNMGLPGLSHPKGTMQMGPLTSNRGRGGGAGNVSNSVTVNVAGTNASPDEIASTVDRRLRNRGRDVAKSLFLRAQEPQTA